VGNNHVLALVSLLPFAALFWSIAWSARLLPRRSSHLLARLGLALLGGVVLTGGIIRQISLYRSLTGIRTVGTDPAFAIVFLMECGVSLWISFNSYSVSRRRQEETDERSRKAFFLPPWRKARKAGERR
jgi:hypothetical protein